MHVCLLCFAAARFYSFSLYFPVFLVPHKCSGKAVCRGLLLCFSLFSLGAKDRLDLMERTGRERAYVGDVVELSGGACLLACSCLAEFELVARPCASWFVE